MKSEELPFVRDMFARIAPHYDFLNRLLSLRRDVVWRKALVAALDLPPRAHVLDAACGTADVAFEVVARAPAGVKVRGIDFAVPMLALARSKVRDAGLAHAIAPVAADLFALPFPARTFDAVTMAFGIRNIQDKLTALQHFQDVLKPGGRLAILELLTPEAGLLRRIYLFYFHRLLPLIGRFFSRHAFAYAYLPASVASFPSASEFAGLMRQAGFSKVRYRKLTLGIAAVFIGDKSS